MTSSDDAPQDAHNDAHDDARREDPAPRDSGVPVDEDAAWRAIVANYGERAVLEPPARETPRPSPGDGRGLDEGSELPLEPARPVQPSPAPARRATDVPGDGEPTSSHDHDHFVPPDPPPLPRPTPARRLAWSGLFVPPILMLLAVIFAWTFPMWFSLALVASFVGGFVFLVVTMPNSEGEGWDDGAVL